MKQMSNLNVKCEFIALGAEIRRTTEYYTFTVYRTVLMFFFDPKAHNEKYGECAMPTVTLQIW